MGRYNDENEFGKGGQPEGIVFSGGRLGYGSWTRLTIFMALIQIMCLSVGR